MSLPLYLFTRPINHPFSYKGHIYTFSFKKYVIEFKMLFFKYTANIYKYSFWEYSGGWVSTDSAWNSLRTPAKKIFNGRLSVTPMGDDSSHFFYCTQKMSIERKLADIHSSCLFSLYVLLNNVFSPPASPEETSRCWHFFISISPMTFSLFLIFHKRREGAYHFFFILNFTHVTNAYLDLVRKIDLTSSLSSKMPGNVESGQHPLLLNEGWND